MIVVVKIGTSSLTAAQGGLDEAAIRRLAAEVVHARHLGHHVVVVSSGAVAAGLAAFSPESAAPHDSVSLQALSSVGQHRLMRVYDDALSAEGMLAGQVLLAPLDFAERPRYLHARETFRRLMELGVVPVVNENDAICDDEIRFGDNDHLAALVAHLLAADLLLLLTDLPGLFSADPNIYEGATLISEVRQIDHELVAAAGATLSERGRGGMASKLAAARIASWSGVRTVIAAADRPAVVLDAIRGENEGIGTVFPARGRRLSARKLWIAFALRPKGRLVVDEGAREALVERSTSLLAAGVVAVDGRFQEGDAVEIVDRNGAVFAKGITRLGSERSFEWVGRRTFELGDGMPDEVVHRDQLLVLDPAESPRGPTGETARQ